MNLEALSKQYAEDGVVKVEGLFSPGEIEEIRAQLQRYAGEITPGLPPNDVVFEADGVSVRNCWRMEHHDPWFAELAKKKSILDMVGKFVHGEPVLMAVIGLVVGLIVTIPLGTLLLALVQAHLYGQLAAADPMDGRAYIPAAPVAPVAPARPTGPEAAFVIDPELGGRVELGTALGAELGTVTVPPVSQLPPVAPPVDSFAAEVSEWTPAPLPPAPLPPAAADVVDFAPAAPAPDAPAPAAPPADSPSGDEPRSNENGGWGI